MHETRGILTNTAWRAFADAASKVASIALYVVMARELGDAGFGVFTFALMYATLFTALAYFGQDAVLVREVARDRPLLGRYFGNTIALKLLLAVPVLLVALAILALVGASETTLIVTALLGLALTVEAALATVFAVFQAYERMRNIALVLIAQRFATAGVGIAALLAGAGVVAVAVIYVGGALLAVAIGLALLRQVGRPRLQVSPPTWPALMTAAVPLGIAGVFGTILFRIDTIILAAFESTAVVGDYGAAYRLLEATLFLGWAIGGAVYPVLSRLDLSERLADVFEQSLKLTLTATLPLAVGAAVLADPLVETLYGTDFDEAAPALQLLAPSIVLFPIAYVTGLFLIARRRQRFVAVLYGLVTALNVLLNLVLIPAFSLNGAALTTSVTELVLVVPALVLGARLVGGLSWRRIVTGPASAALVAGALMAVLASSFWLAVAAGGAAYLVVLAAVERLAFPADARAFSAFLRRRELPV